MEKAVFIQFSIRIPVELNEKLEREATTEKRKKNQQVNIILENHFENNGSSDEAIKQ